MDIINQELEETLTKLRELLSTHKVSQETIVQAFINIGLPEQMGVEDYRKCLNELSRAIDQTTDELRNRSMK